MSKDEVEKEALRHHERFELIRELRRVQGSQLVLCADVLDHIVEHTARVLERAVAAEKAKGGFYSPFFESLWLYSPRRYAPGDAEIWCAGSLNPPAPL